jgi:RHS repeat-associated protein
MKNLHRDLLISPLSLLLATVLSGLSASSYATESVRYYYTDQQGTVIAASDAAGTLVNRTNYRPYGALASGVSDNDPGYTGHVGDSDTQLIYMQARYYDPMFNRFLSQDPSPPQAGNIFNFNTYAYADNSPTNNVDKDGRCIWDGCIVELAIAGALIGGAIDIAAQKYFRPNQPINKTEVAISAGGGMVSGGTSAVLTEAAVGGTITVSQAILRQAAVNGAVGAGQSVAGDLANGQRPSGQAALNAAGASIGGSLLGSGISVAAGDFAGASASRAMSTMSSPAANTPAGIGATIANTTSELGSTAARPSYLQSAASQTARVGDVVATFGEKKLNNGSSQ